MSGMIQWRSEHGLYEAPSEVVQACTEYYAEWDTDKLADIVGETHGDDSCRQQPRIALLVMLSEWGAFGAHIASWHDHKGCQGFTATESANGWHCYTHNLFNQQD